MKKKVKKEIKLIILGIVCLIVILMLLNRNNGNNKKIDANKKLAGHKIISGLYEYNFEEKNSIQNVSIKNNNIYYLTDNESTYKLYEIDIYTNKTKEVGTLESDVCLLNDYYLTSFKGNMTTIYDTDLKEIYKSDKKFNIVPYQGSFLIVEDKEIYLKDRKIRTIKDDIERFDIIKYYVSDDNTFIEFVSINDTYIYNVKDDSYEKLDYNNIYSYDKGFYYGNKDKIIFKNLDNRETKEYNNFKKDDDFSISTIKDNLFFYIDNKYLKIFNLETNKLKCLDYKFVNSMDQIIINDNYLYLIYQGKNPEIYVVKIDEIDSKEYTIDEYKEMKINKISEKIKKIEDRYNSVEIIYDTKDIEGYDNWDEELVNEDRYELIDDALDAIDNVFDKFGNEFISLFKHDDYKGLRIIVAKQIITGKDASVKNIDGLFFPNYTNYNIIISKGVDPFEKLFYHEMMHAIDHNASNHKYDISGKWYDYNPKDFEYNIAHFNNGNTQYTTYVYGEEDAYFVDAYSKINQSEDRARIFENICYVDDENIIKKYPSLLRKAKYIRDELIKYYPSLKNSKIFDSIENE